MKSFSVLLQLIVLTFFVTSCSAGITSKRATSLTAKIGTTVTQPQTITVTSKDDVVKLVLPDDWQDIWTEADQERWSLLVGNRSDHTQIGLRSIRKADYPNITSEAHAKAALIAAKAPFADAEMIEEGESTTVNGHRAMRYQVKGMLAGQPLVALSWSVETPDYYHGIFVIGSEQNFAQQQDELNQIIQSLQET
jgi:hypothetical protein